MMHEITDQMCMFIHLCLFYFYFFVCVYDIYEFPCLFICRME